MSSEISTYIDSLLKKKDKDNSYKFWKLDDDDQIKAVTGICFTFAALFIIGLFFSLVSTSLIASNKLDTNSYFFFFNVKKFSYSLYYSL